ncbi:MAG: RrF2 family transcriptional regulator [Treponema sp.]|nr:RrF2 family transcriptional regulator [Treponema sp.]
MLVSTRGRYALRVLIDLAQQPNDTWTPLKEIASRQDISQKYIEAIMTLLSKNGLVDAVHGKGGGYKLNRDIKDYKVGEVLNLTEGSLSPVACLMAGAEPCPKAPNCKTLPMWTKLNSLVNDYLNSVSLADLI